MFIKEAWFWRGFQSAVFYYISCAPCTKILDQRKKKQNAARAKAEKVSRKAVNMQMEENGEPPQYDHPLPSSTNPFWEEEMQLGPGPPPKRRNNRHPGASEGQGKEQGIKDKTRKKSGNLEMAQANSLTPAVKAEEGSNSSKGTNGSETVGIPQITTHEPPDADWNRRRYQREDELLWGLEDEEYDQSHTFGSSSNNGAPKSSRPQKNYYYARNPAVNDLHPPVVSTAPTSRSETQWMLQPPPRARIMEGKERENRSRSGTGSTQSSRASSKRAGLGRQLSHKAFETMVTQPSRSVDGRGEQSQTVTHLGAGGIGMSRSRGSSNQSLASGQRHDKDASSQGHPSPNSLQPSRSSSQRKAAPPPIALDNDPAFLSPPPMRPGLQTIPSTSLVTSPSNKKDEKRNEKNTSLPPTNSPVMMVSNGEKGSTTKISSTATALQELVIPPSTNQLNRSSSLNIRDEKQDQERIDAVDHATPFPGAERGWGRPTANGHGIGEVDDVANDENEWLAENFRHRHRWSMDF